MKMSITPYDAAIDFKFRSPFSFATSPGVPRDPVNDSNFISKGTDGIPIVGGMQLPPLPVNPASQGPNPTGAVWEYLQQVYGNTMQEIEANVTTGATPVVAIPGDPDCLAALIINLGINDVNLALLTNAVSATFGILLTASGGTLALNIRDDLTLPSKQWAAISPAGPSTLYTLRMKRR
jgi:hypothetical protein